MSHNEIVSMPRTEEAFDDLYANMVEEMGSHANETLALSDVKLSIAAQPFNPLTHDPRDIDLTLIESLITGIPHVSVGLTHRPVTINIIQDRTPRRGSEKFSQQKNRLAGMLAESLLYVVPHRDPTTGSLLGPDLISADLHEMDEVIEAETRADGAVYAAQLALNGLSIIFSDFRDLNFAPRSLENVVAVKVNHLMERSVPHGIGVISLGGGVELNTRKQRQVNAYNQKLEREHGAILDNLQSAGAVVVPVVADLRIKPNGFDVNQTDLRIAEALNSLAAQA
jgi:hypothetical protein